MKIAIIGYSGINATTWTSSFLNNHWTIRTLARKPTSDASGPFQEYAYFDFEQAETYRTALRGVDVLALVTPADPRQYEWEKGLIDAAKAEGLRRIIKLSVIGADLAKPISPFARGSAQSEAYLLQSKVPYVILRANMYMQNVLRQTAGIWKGVYSEPSGGAPASLLDVRDIADCAVAVAGGGYDDQIFTLTGPESLSGEQMALAISSAARIPVRFVSPEISTFRAAMESRGLPSWRVEGQVELYTNIQAGNNQHLPVLTRAVQDLTGHAPRSFEAFAREHFSLMSQNPLFVFALQSEAAGEFDHVNPLIMGIGKVNAAYHLTKRIHESRPDLIINLGSAGSSSFKRGEVVCITRFVQRDMDVRPLGYKQYETPFMPFGSGLDYGLKLLGLPEGTCGTGDNFELAHATEVYNVVDMEAFALAQVAWEEQIPFLCLKYISDGADGQAAEHWEEMVHQAAAAFKTIVDAW